MACLISGAKSAFNRKKKNQTWINAIKKELLWSWLQLVESINILLVEADNGSEFVKVYLNYPAGLKNRTTENSSISVKHGACSQVVYL